MKRVSIHGLGAEVALALTIHLLPPPHKLGDARIFTAGRVHLLGWQDLADDDRLRIAHFLRLRPVGITEDRGLLEAARLAFDRRERFQWADTSLDDDLAKTFEPVPGKPIVRLLDELLEQLEKRQKPKPVRLVGTSSEVNLRAGEITYTIPPDHIPSAQAISWPTVNQAPVTPARIDRTRLLVLADKLDSLAGSTMQRRTVLERLFSGLTIGPEQHPFGDGVDVPPGPTQIFGAPTGVGKSVLAHLLALDHASRGIPVVMVEPDIKTTLRNARRLEGDARDLGLRLSIVPVASLDGLSKTLIDIMQHPPADDPEGAWTLERLGYFCRLSAYANKEPHAFGSEPCTRLHQIDGKKPIPVTCPFAADCPKLDTHRNAAAADIVLINHQALLAGRVRLPMQVGECISPQMSMMELVLRRGGLILIDEIDQLQMGAIDKGTGSLKLSSSRGLSPLHELLDDFERRRAEADPPPEFQAHQLRRHIILMRWLPEELCDGINARWLHWPNKDRMRLSRAKDGWLAARLFGDAKDASPRLDAIFRDQIIGNGIEEELRKAVERWRKDQLDSADGTEQLKQALMEVLERWPGPLNGKRKGANVQRSRHEVASAIALRAVLGRLEESLNFLRPQLAFLDELELRNASQVRNALLGYTTWRPSPLGPLGYRAMGFSFPRHGEQPGDLHVQSLAGDPHGLVRGLGDEVALALAGCARPVLGFSATARFPGSPKADVLAPLLLARADAQIGVSVEGVTITDPENDGKPIRVSGVSDSAKRRKQATQLGRLLPDQFLRGHLASLARNGETASRARVLLATGSYIEAKAVATGLIQAARNENERRGIRYLSRRRDESDEHALLPREIESFGQTNANILVAPLSVVSRGHNILAPGTDHSAIGSIFVLVRPVPPAEEASRALSHLSYAARRTAIDASRPGDALDDERRAATRRLRSIHEHAGPFSRLPAELRHEVLCDVLVELAQLAGRARRGDTDVRLYLVDAAFHDEEMGWRQLLAQTFERWKVAGELQELLRLHGAFLYALARFAGVALD